MAAPVTTTRTYCTVRSSRPVDARKWYATPYAREEKYKVEACVGVPPGQAVSEWSREAERRTHENTNIGETIPYHVIAGYIFHPLILTLTPKAPIESTRGVAGKPGLRWRAARDPIYKKL